MCDQISILLVTIFFCFHDIQYILLEYITVSHFYFLIPLRYNKNIVGNVMWPLTYIEWKKYLCFIFAVLEKIYYRIKFVGFMLSSSKLLRWDHQKNGLLQQKIRGRMKPILWDLNLCFDSFICPFWWRINEQLNYRLLRHIVFLKTTFCAFLMPIQVFWGKIWEWQGNRHF